MNTAPEALQGVFDRAFAGISQVREALTQQLTPREVGTITNISTAIARVFGLLGVGLEELLEFPGGVFGIAFIAMDTILNQCGKDVVCVYCAIGQRASAMAKAVANLRESGSMDLHRRPRIRGQRPARSRLYRTLPRDQHHGAFYGAGP